MPILLNRFGQVEDIKIIRKNSSGQPLKDYIYGFIVMSDENDANNAIDSLNHDIS